MDSTYNYAHYLQSSLFCTLPFLKCFLPHLGTIKFVFLAMLLLGFDHLPQKQYRTCYLELVVSEDEQLLAVGFASLFKLILLFWI